MVDAAVTEGRAECCFLGWIWDLAMFRGVDKRVLVWFGVFLLTICPGAGRGQPEHRFLHQAAKLQLKASRRAGTLGKTDSPLSAYNPKLYRSASGSFLISSQSRPQTSRNWTISLRAQHLHNRCCRCLVVLFARALQTRRRNFLTFFLTESV